MATMQKLCVAMGAQGASTEILSPALYTNTYPLLADTARAFTVPPGLGIKLVRFSVSPYCNYFIAWGATDANTIAWPSSDVTDGSGYEDSPAARFIDDGQTVIANYCVIANQNCILSVSYYTGVQLKLL